MTDRLYLIGDIIMATALLGVIVFVSSYAFFFAWRKTHAGKALMYFATALAIWGVQSFAARLSPDYPFRAWTRLGVYLLISITVWGLVITLWRSWSRPLNIKSQKGDTNVEP